MARLLVCLPICLLLNPAYPGTPLDPRQASTELVGKERLPSGEPIAFLEKCLERYDREVKGYTLTLRKQERVGGVLHPLERIEVAYKDDPPSVFFKWLEGARKALRVLWIKGANEDRMLVLPTLKILGVVSRTLDSPDAKASGRYTIDQFGLRKGMERVLRSWKKVRAEKNLTLEYLGVHRVPETGNRPCYKLQAHYARPEGDGVTDVTVYVDKETLLQVGSVLHGEKGQLIAEYFFRDIRINPTFPPDQFTRAALTAK
jgi:Protein of unknown function (DUF1571)